jgi:predicted amidohydrolase YtcJ
VITLAIVNARVWTGNPRKPWASGIAAEGDRIVAVGSSAEVAKLVSAGTRVIDAKGMFVTSRADEDFAGLIERGNVASFVIVDRDGSQLSREAFAGLKKIVEIRAGEILHDAREE